MIIWIFGHFRGVWWQPGCHPDGPAAVCSGINGIPIILAFGYFDRNIFVITMGIEEIKSLVYVRELIVDIGATL